MEFLVKYKKKGVEGFKECVESFETTSLSHLKEKVESYTLEDPVYMEWVLRNIMKIDHFIQLTSDEIQKVCENIKSYGEILARAFYKSPLEAKLATELPKHIHRSYQDEAENVKELKKSTQEQAVFTIIKTLRKMQDAGLIATKNPWRLPPADLLRYGTKPPGNGLFKLNYENKNPALEGMLNKNQREGGWKHYYPNGQLMAQGNYSSGLKSGVWTFWYSTGEKKSSGEYLLGRKNGTWVEWDKQGKIKEVAYNNDKLIA